MPVTLPVIEESLSLSLLGLCLGVVGAREEGEGERTQLDSENVLFLRMPGSWYLAQDRDGAREYLTTWLHDGYGLFGFLVGVVEYLATLAWAVLGREIPGRWPQPGGCSGQSVTGLKT